MYRIKTLNKISSAGLDLLDQELLNQWERFCRLSQERL